MIKLYESYLEYLSANPGEFTSIILWTLTSIITTTILVVYRKKMVHGATGANGFMESAEQVIWIMNWIWPYVLTFSAFFQAELPDWCWWFMSGCIAWALGGRWLFEWALALRAGVTSVNTSKTEAKVEVKTETTTS